MILSLGVALGAMILSLGVTLEAMIPKTGHALGVALVGSQS